MGIFRSLAGMISIQVESADISGFISELGKNGIPIFNLKQTGDICASCDVYRKDWKYIYQCANKKGNCIKVSRKTGIYWYLKNAVSRPVLLLGLVLLAMVAFYLPGRILFIRVDGNVDVPTQRILESSQICGLRFGSDRRELRSEKIKNGLLESIPELQWVGVNSAGCVATISVRERAIGEKKTVTTGVSSIVAVRDGIILSCTGTKGNLICKPGQAVKAGEVLISGYTDCGLSIRAEHAQGDVYAQTSHSLHVVLPADSQEKGNVVEQHKNYALLIGKNRMNLYKDSGILSGGCDKIYKEYYLILPGGFQLPVAIVEETWYTYDSAVISVSEDSAQGAMRLYAQEYLLGHMVGGQIQESTFSVDLQEDLYVLRGKYICTEMIGRVRNEEIIKGNGEDH